MRQNSVSVKKIVIKDELKFNGVTLLTYKIEYPEIHSSCYRLCMHKVNRYYKKKALEYQKYCVNELFSMAIKLYNDAIENDFPIHVFEALQVYEVTCPCACIFSLYFDRYEYTGGAHGNTIRDSQTWDLQKCGLIKLKKIVRCLSDYKTYVLLEVERQIRINPDLYFENYKDLIAETFNENSFYCKPEGVVLYYQQYDIAPYSSGIREFLIPYSDCVLDPQKLCFPICI